MCDVSATLATTGRVEHFRRRSVLASPETLTGDWTHRGVALQDFELHVKHSSNVSTPPPLCSYPSPSRNITIPSSY
jgi:hypothetical protein